ncbi:MAG: alpha/beta hydrolase [Halorientalis sp.]
MTDELGDEEANGAGNTHGEDTQTLEGEKTRRISRRSVLKTTSTAAVGAVGVEAVSGTAAATGDEQDELDLGLLECAGGWADPDYFREVNLDPAWWCGKYDSNFDVNDLSDEITVYIHGFESDLLAKQQGATLRNNINFNGDVIDARWPATDVTYTGPYDRAAEYGHKFAEWLMEVLWAQTNTRVNIVGHSLGGRAALNVLNKLQRTDGFNKEYLMKNVVTVGPADMVRFVCKRNETGTRIFHYYDGINQIADKAYVFYSENDFAVGGLHELWGDLFWYTPDGEGLGAHGVTCSNAPDNLYSVDVTDKVGNHCEYFKSDGAPGEVSQAVNGATWL